MKIFIAAILSIAIITSLSISAFAADTTDTENQGGDSSFSLTDTDAGNPEYAVIKQDYQTIVNLRQEEKTLLASIKDITEANKDLSESIRAEYKSELATAKDSVKQSDQPTKDKIAQLKQQVQSINDLKSDLRSQFDALKSQMKAVDSDIKANQSSIVTSWNSFKTALSSKDYTAADAALKDIIAFKQQIITDMNTIIGLKQQVTVLLNDFASSQSITVAA